MTNQEREVARKTALRAAELVEAGWCQGRNASVVDGKPRYCSIGALYHAADELGGVDRLDDIVSNAINAAGADSLIKWNDDPSRTQSEVVALFRRVAAYYNPPGWDSVEV